MHRKLTNMGPNNIPTSEGNLAADEILDELTYASFRHNADMAPHIPLERWAAIFPEGEKLARRLARERSGN